MTCFLLHFNLDYCLYETLSSWECLSLHFTSYFPLFLFRNAVFCAITVLYTDPSLVSNNYLGSKKCSVDNHFHFSSECLVSYCSQFRLLSVWNIIQLRMSIFTVNVIFPLCSSSEMSGNRDNCLVNSTFLVSNNYLNSNKCSLDNNFHFSSECIVYICSSV